MMKETHLSTGPYSVSILGNTAPVYVFKTRKTEADRKNAAGLLAEIAKHQAALDELKNLIQEAQ